MKDFIDSVTQFTASKIANVGLLKPVTQIQNSCEYVCTETSRYTALDGAAEHIVSTCLPTNCQSVEHIVSYRITELGEIEFLPNIGNTFASHFDAINDFTQLNDHIAKQLERQIKTQFYATLEDSQKDISTILDLPQQMQNVIESAIPSGNTIQNWGRMLVEKFNFFQQEEPKTLCEWDSFSCHKEAIQAQFATCNGENRYACYWNTTLDYLKQYNLTEIWQSACEKYLPEQEDAMMYGAIAISTTALLIGSYYLYRHKNNHKPINESLLVNNAELINDIKLEILSDDEEISSDREAIIDYDEINSNEALCPDSDDESNDLGSFGSWQPVCLNTSN